MLTISIQRNLPEINPQRAVDAFNSSIPQILDAPSVKRILEMMSVRPSPIQSRKRRKNKPSTLPNHWHVEILNGDVHIFNDLPYAKYVYAPRRVGIWPVAQKVEEDMASNVHADMDKIWRQANASALFVR